MAKYVIWLQVLSEPLCNIRLFMTTRLYLYIGLQYAGVFTFYNFLGLCYICPSHLGILT
jgi:hypothetical protein